MSSVSAPGARDVSVELSAVALRLAASEGWVTACKLGLLVSPLLLALLGFRGGDTATMVAVPFAYLGVLWLIRFAPDAVARWLGAPTREVLVVKDGTLWLGLEDEAVSLKLAELRGIRHGHRFLWPWCEIPIHLERVDGSLHTIETLIGDRRLFAALDRVRDHLATVPPTPADPRG